MKVAMQKCISANVYEHLRTSSTLKTKQRTFTKPSERTSTNMLETQMQKCRSAKIYEHHRNSKQNSEHLRNSASEHQRTRRKTEIRKCRNADLRQSLYRNICETQNKTSRLRSLKQNFTRQPLWFNIVCFRCTIDRISSNIILDAVDGKFARR